VRTGKKPNKQQFSYGGIKVHVDQNCPPNSAYLLAKDAVIQESIADLAAKISESSYQPDALYLHPRAARAFMGLDSWIPLSKDSYPQGKPDENHRWGVVYDGSQQWFAKRKDAEEFCKKQACSGIYAAVVKLVSDAIPTCKVRTY
jgi:hypothetical protein